MCAPGLYIIIRPKIDWKNIFLVKWEKDKSFIEKCSYGSWTLEISFLKAVYAHLHCRGS